MPTIVFGGAYLRHIDLRRNAEGTIFVRLDLTSDLTIALAERLRILDARETEMLRSAVLTIEDIPIGEFTLKANGLPALAEMVAHRMSDFRIFRSREEDGEPGPPELRFHIWGPGAAVTLVHDYWAVVGEGRGQLRVTLAEQATLEPEAKGAVQTTLDGGEEKVGEKPRRRRRKAPEESAVEPDATVQ